MSNNKFMIFRVSENILTKLSEIAQQRSCSMSHLVREAVCKRYRIKDKVRKCNYLTEKRPGHPGKNRWAEAEIVKLVKLYKPKSHGNKKMIAEQLGRSYWVIKHKVNELKLAS